jgi:hypothetical protein
VNVPVRRVALPRNRFRRTSVIPKVALDAAQDISTLETFAMRLDHLRVLVALSVLIPMGQARAQRCMGVASFASGSGRIAAGASLTGGSKNYGMHLAIGQDKGAFASGTFSRTTFDNASFALTGLAGSIGYQLELGDRSNVEFCPVAGVSYFSGSHGYGASYVDVSSTEFGFGGSVGFVASSSASFELVPAVGFQYLTNNSKAMVTAFGNSSSGTGSSNYGIVSVSAGFVFNKSVTLQPIIEIPVSLANGKASYGIGIGLNFGEKKK